MKFEHPGVLFAFLLLAIPILVHLFNFRKYKTLYFSSLIFVKQVDQEAKSVQKLKHLLVLLARLLTFSALIIAFAQPYKPLTAANEISGTPVLAIYLDNSFSMTLKGTEGELLSEGREQARKIIQNTSDATQIMLVTNELSGIEQRLYTKTDALTRLDKLAVGPQTKSIGQIIAFIQENLAKEANEQQHIGNKQIVIISDFQENSGDFSAIKADDDAHYYPIQLVSQETTNISIDSIWFADPNFKMSVNNELAIKVTNHSTKDLKNIELQLLINKSKRDAFIDIPANQTIVTTINYSDYKPGLKKGTIKINDQQLFFDDEYHFVYEVKEHISVLIINGKDAVNSIATVYGLDSYYQVANISETAFNRDHLTGKELVVLNGLNTLTSGFEQVIASFASEGGALLIFPGETIDVQSYNTLLSRLKMPLLGDLLSEGIKLKSIQSSDRFFKGVFDKKPEMLHLPLQTKVYQTKSTGKSNAISLLTLQNGLPLFTRSNSGVNSFLFTSSLSPNYGNFTSNALFSTLLLRVGELSQRSTPLSLTIGKDSKFPIYTTLQRESPLHLLLDEIDFILPTERIEQQQYISLAGPTSSQLKQGIYTLKSEQEIGKIALNYQRSESQMKFLTASDISDQLALKGIKNSTFSSIKEGQSIANIQLQKPVEYWRIFVILCLVFILTEMCLIRFIN